ncbi:MAG: hypothetical protein HYX94_03705 [Chloroflexi bacterium]|nr:hypothetical protein [Chloroflexota bacterium]
MRKDSSPVWREDDLPRREYDRPAVGPNNGGLHSGKKLRGFSSQPRSAARSDTPRAGKFVPGSIMDSSRRQAAPVVTSGGYRPGSIILRRRQQSQGVESSS